MYFVVRKDLPLARGEAIARAGAAAALCERRFASDARFGAAWAEWAAASFRKVALRAGPEEIARVEDEHPCVSVPTSACGELLCLPPLRRSQRPDLLASLRPFTDAPRPPRPPARLGDDVPAMLYALRPGVMKTAGKAIAQAGHAALMAVAELGSERRASFDAWYAAGAPGEAVLASDEQWEELKRDPGSVVVRDGGLTQVEPGTETVIALAPAPRRERSEPGRSLPPLDGVQKESDPPGEAGRSREE